MALAHGNKGASRSGIHDTSFAGGNLPAPSSQLGSSTSRAGFLLFKFMKPLESYKKNGHTFTLYCRYAMLAIFHGKRTGGNSETWEVIHIQSHNGREVHGAWCEPAEYPPSNEQWGSKGWSFSTPEAARERFELEIRKAQEVADAKDSNNSNRPLDCVTGSNRK